MIFPIIPIHRSIGFVKSHIKLSCVTLSMYLSSWHASYFEYSWFNYWLPSLSHSQASKTTLGFSWWSEPHLFNTVQNELQKQFTNLITKGSGLNIFI
jgi:hypothetical protein